MAERTEGHRLLEGRRPADVVRATGRTFPTVLRWFGKGKPDIDSAVKLREIYGIPVEAWTQPVGKKRKAS